MITADPARRAALLGDLQQRLAHDAAPDDRERLQAFASVVFPEMPDSMALQLEPAAVAARLAGAFRFVAKSMPPEHQLYRGLPGLHVSVRNPDEAEEAATGSASGHYHEVTIVETHTPDAPFIFESLKNFFQNEGLRVFSAIHPIFTVRRQWERVAWIGGPADDGSRELYCQFRIERVEAREKLTALMEREKVFTRPGMCLNELARLLGMPEYRVRRHINQNLGYQNFHQFLNFYRVREARRVLASPGGAEVPVYNLAMDLGFGGVSSFHRVFKNETGMTPAQYRESCRAGTEKAGV